MNSENKPLPPEPPKPRCIAEEPDYKANKHKESVLPFKIWIAASLIVLFANMCAVNKLSDMKVDPARTDDAVQAGIRECERSLPRTQTCELSQLSFKVVEKKGW